jgi:hypothetical protein
MPCRAMDINIYPKQRIGDYINEKFISVRYQMDTSKKDDAQTKEKYADAHLIMSTYQVYVYPTYLFFSSDGELVHRAAGGYNENGFLELASDAVDTNKQYFNMLKAYNEGYRDTASLKKLARETSLLGNKQLAKQIAENFFPLINSKNLSGDNLQFLMEFDQGLNAYHIAQSYIDGLKGNEMYDPINISFIARFTTTSKDRGFNFFYKNAAAIDKIMKPGYAESAVDFVIKKELIKPVAWPNDKISAVEPNWNNLYIKIKKKYNKVYAERNILNEKIAWYYSKRMWTEYTSSIVSMVDKYGKNFDVYLNNSFAWSIFKLSNKEKELRAALNWIEPFILKDSSSPNALDTYANLLYKLGRKNEALKWEQMAVKNGSDQEDIVKNYQKMQQGLPTWPKL